MSALPALLRRRASRWLLGLAALAAAGWWVAGALRDEGQGGWVDVQRGELVLDIEAEGTLRAVETSTLGPPQVPWIWEYKIAMMAPEGNEVRAGQPVLAFDSSELERRLQEKIAEAEGARKEIEKREAELALTRRQDELRLAEAEARLRKARLKVDVPEELTSDQALREARLDLELAGKETVFLRGRLDGAERSAQAALRSLRSRRDRADARVREIRDAIEAMTVKAPRDGTVIYVSDWQDEKKKVGDSCWRGEGVVEIPDLRRMACKGEVDEADSSRVAVGQRVSLRLDAHPDEEFTGRVSHIWSTVQTKSWRNPLKVVRLDIDLDRTDVRRMRPGMRFRATIETERVPGLLVLPVEAVFVQERGPVVFRKTLLGFEAVAVRLGRRNERKVEVLEGLAEGDRVSRVDLSERERA